MKLMDKLKNALFEEEYVEVEEKPKKVKKKDKKEKKPVKPVKENTVEKPIAKKIVLPERKEVHVTTHDNQEEIQKQVEVHKEEDSKLEVEKDFKFPMVSDSEFTYEKEEKFKKPKVDNIEPPRKEEKKKILQSKEKKARPYGIDDMPIKEPEYGGYEKKEEKPYFKPSPIISPIYGILDKNYKREDVIPKREVRLSSVYTREGMDVDEVRKRAYGPLEDELELNHNKKIEDSSSIMDNDLLDLSVDTPKVSKVTVGDAEEYFEDLGLEYNVDYKDGLNEKKEVRYQVEKEEGPYIMKEENRNDIQEPVVKPVEQDLSSSDDLDEDNLFDLIDSMYKND